jgi:hypothetical protein
VAAVCLAASFHVQINDVEKTEWKLEEKTVENARECMTSIKHLFWLVDEWKRAFRSLVKPDISGQGNGASTTRSRDEEYWES